MIRTDRSGSIQSFYVLILLAFLLGLTGASAVFSRSMPVRRVPLNDEVGLLDAQTSQEVKRFSQLLYRDHRSELAVLIISSTNGQNAGQYAEQVFNHWGLGQAGVNNGMLILFAMNDRRVEIKPGIRYRNRFSESFCTNLLNRYVVPEMKAGRAKDGVLAAVREVAAEIRNFETSGQSAANVGNSSAQTRSGEHSSTGSGNYSSSGSKNAVPVKPLQTTGSSPRPTRRGLGLPPLKADMVRLIIFGIIALVTCGGIYYFYQAYWFGRLLMPVWMFVILVMIGGASAVGLVSTLPDFFQGGLDVPFSGAGGVAFLSFLWCASHVCPRCNMYMSISTRTLRSPTYYSSGLGEKTVHCESCGYHKVSTYTISRRTKSSSSRGGSRSSGGGGRSSGGGGGASW